MAIAIKPQIYEKKSGENSLGTKTRVRVGTLKSVKQSPPFSVICTYLYVWQVECVSWLRLGLQPRSQVPFVYPLGDPRSLEAKTLRSDPSGSGLVVG